MEEQIYVVDTCDVVFRRKSDKHVVFSYETQLASLSGTLSEEIIRGGIGNKPLYPLRHSKEVSLTARNGLFDLEWLAMSQGVKIEGKTVQVTKVEKGLKVVDNTGILEVEITGTPVGNTVRIINGREQEDAAVVGGNVTIPEGFAVAGDLVVVEYKEEIQGDVVEIDADAFSENYEVEYHTIAYSKKTNKVIKDLYFQFDNVLPSGAFDLSFENGSASTPEMTFNCYANDTDGAIGRVVEKLRVA